MAKRRKKDAEEFSPLEDTFLKAYMETGNATDAAEIACNVKNRKSAASRGHQLMKKLDKPIKKLAKQAGFSRLMMLRALKDGMNANRAHLFQNPNTGEIVEHLTPDWSARATHLNMALKVFGEYEKQQMELQFGMDGDKVLVSAEFATASGAGDGA